MIHKELGHTYFPDGIIERIQVDYERHGEKGIIHHPPAYRHQHQHQRNDHQINAEIYIKFYFIIAHATKLRYYFIVFKT